MDYKLIVYKAKRERAAENERLVRDVFAELKAAAPDGARYAVLRLADDTFVHVVGTEPGGFAVLSLAAFQRFQADVEERQEVPAENRGAAVIGNYRMLAE